MTVDYPRTFASSVPICGVVGDWNDTGSPLITDDQLAAIGTPSWLVASRDDTTVDPIANSVHAHDLIPGSIISLYDTVTWEGVRFPGHWSWIYVAHNDPQYAGQHVWQWMASRKR